MTAERGKESAPGGRFAFPAAILAGGMSRRMGREKHLLPLGGEPLIRRMARLLEGVFSRVLVVAVPAAPFAELGFEAVEDLLPGNDSLGGLHAAVSHARAPHVFVCGCDMPFLQPALLRGLASRADGADVVIPILGGYPESLCAVYGQGCEAPIRRRIGECRLKMIGFHEEVRTVRVEEAEWRAWDPEGLSFRNLNTPEDYARAQAALAAEKGDVRHAG
ncbi:MAG: molybdenum cofactor guanylyltransferase [Nitrospinota bacterium]